MTDLQFIKRGDDFAEAKRLLPDADDATLVQVALSLTRARMMGESRGYSKAAADLELMASRLRSGAEVLKMEKRGNG